MLPTYVLLQVIGCYVANGILTPELVTLPFFSRRAAPVKQNSWHLLLKSAMFRTLSKYTDFSPSLDMKMEADTLLWEKLEGAKYIEKSKNEQEKTETTSTGLLVDMIRESGYLEFRQIDNTHYNFEPGDQRILALWKVQSLDQNHYLIQIKIPQEPPIEDKYEYTIQNGLQEIMSTDSTKSKNKQHKNASWKSNYNKSARSVEPANGDYSIKRQDSYILKAQTSPVNKYKVPDNYKINKVTPRAYLYKPIQYYTLLGFQTPPPVSKYPTWGQSNNYYPVNNYKLFPEFKQDAEYNGFIPSLGPAGNTPLYQTNPIEPLPYQQLHKYYQTYTSPQIVTTSKPLTISYFKPSAQYIQYSEIDPFYTTDENYTNGPILTAEMPTMIPTTTSIGNYQQIIYESPLPAITIDIPPLNPGESLYDSAIISIKNESSIHESIPQPTSTTLIINYPETSKHLIDNNDDPTTEIPKDITSEMSSTTEKIFKTRGKNSIKSPHHSSLTGTDNYDYAPFYIKWGEKIKPSKAENKHRNLTQKSTINYLGKENKNKLKEGSISLEGRNKTKEEEKEVNTPVPDEIKLSTTSGLDFTITPFPPEVNTTNYSLNNLTLKSPEEIVSDLTILGLVNSTVDLTQNKSIDIDNRTADSEPQITSKHEDNQEDGSEPISVVVNRISQSFSYKTSDGHIRNLKQLAEKT